MSLLVTGFVGLNVALIWSDDPLSHWRSSEARMEFERLHAESMSALPPHRTEDVSTAYGVVRVHVFAGSGGTDGRAPLVLLPGGMASSTMWAGNIPRLMRERTVIAVDALGQPGGSVQQRPIRSASDQAAWLNQALAGLDVSHAHVVGVSQGGWLAANLARHHPERITTLSLIEPVYVFAPARPSLIVGAILSAFPLLPTAYGRWYADWVAGGSTGRGHVAGAAMEHARRHFTVVAPPPDPFDIAELAAIDVPVYAVVAGRSVAHDVDEVIKGSNAVHQLELDVVPDGSHAVHAQQGVWLDQQILGFTDRHDPA